MSAAAGRCWRAGAVLCALILLLPGCGGDPEGRATLRLGWTFADGRGCPESAVETVHVFDLDVLLPLSSTTCAAGFGAARLGLDLPAGQRRLRLEGRSAVDTTLYRRTLDLELDPGATAQRLVDLYFVGGL